MDSLPLTFQQQINQNYNGCFLLVPCHDLDDLENVVDCIEKKPEFKTCVILGDDIEKLKSDYLSLYKCVEASGGVVRNQNKDILMIYRNNRWDLPKGKIDSGETPEVAAIREVKEETGIRDLDLVRPLISTFHTFKIDGERYFKQTRWFEMESQPFDRFEPQLEEGITEVLWADNVKLPECLANSYNSIEDVIRSL